MWPTLIALPGRLCESIEALQKIFLSYQPTELGAGKQDVGIPAEALDGCRLANKLAGNQEEVKTADES